MDVLESNEDYAVPQPSTVSDQFNNAELVGACQVYESRILELTNKFNSLTHELKDLKEVSATKAKLGIALHGYEDFLRSRLTSYPQLAGKINELIKNITKKLSVSEETFQTYRQNVGAHSGSATPNLSSHRSKRSKSHRSRSSTSTKLRARLLEIEAEEKLRIAQAEADSMLKKAQILRESSSAGSVSSYQTSQSFKKLPSINLPIRNFASEQRLDIDVPQVNHRPRSVLSAPLIADRKLSSAFESMPFNAGVMPTKPTIRESLESYRYQSEQLDYTGTANDGIDLIDLYITQAKSTTEHVNGSVSPHQVTHPLIGNSLRTGTSLQVTGNPPCGTIPENISVPRLMTSNHLDIRGQTALPHSVVSLPNVNQPQIAVPTYGIGGEAVMPQPVASFAHGMNCQTVVSHQVTGPLPNCSQTETSHQASCRTIGASYPSAMPPINATNSGIGAACMTSDSQRVVSGFPNVSQSAFTSKLPPEYFSVAPQSCQDLFAMPEDLPPTHIPNLGVNHVAQTAPTVAPTMQPVNQPLRNMPERNHSHEARIDKPASKDDMYLMCRTIQQALLNRGPIVPKFNGDPKNYPIFIKNFRLAYWHKNSNPFSVLSRLIEHCTGPAHDSIKHLALCDDSAEALRTAEQILRFRFGNRSLVIDSYIRELIKKERLKPNDSDGLNKLASQMRTCYTIFANWGAQAMLDAQAYLEAIFLRLPRNIQNSYFSTSTFLEVLIPSFVHLLKFIEQQAFLYSSFFGRKMFQQDSQTSNTTAKKPQPKASAFTMVSSAAETKDNTPKRDSKTASTKCPNCSMDHLLCRCESFRKMTVEERREFVTKKGLCRNCLRATDHFSKDCPSDKRCRVEGCNRNHHTMLHLITKPHHQEASSTSTKGETDSNTRKPTQTVSVGVCNNEPSCSIDEPHSVRLMVLPVTVMSPSRGHVLNTYAFLDTGATRTLIRPELAKKLDIVGQPENCRIRTLGRDMGEMYSGNCATFDICGFGLDEVVTVPNALTFEGIPDVSHSIPSTEIAQRYAHLSDLTFPNLGNKVDILLGLDVLCRLPILESRLGPDNCDLTGFKNSLGWSLAGPSKPLGVTSASINLIDTNLEHLNLCEMCQMATDPPYRTVDPLSPQPSIEDKRALASMEKTFKLENGRITIGFPWKYDKVDLPNNYSVALSRLESLRRRFQKDKDFFEKYKTKIMELFDNGYATVVSDTESMSIGGKNWFLPHHATRQAKFRVVFDSSAVYERTSLNKNLLTGEDHNNSLFGVLLRFRCGKYAFSCDIRQMYHRIFLQKQDVDAVKFLWFPDHDYTKPPIVCRLLVVPFGSTASPSLAVFSLHKLASLNPPNVGKPAVHLVKRAFYVDDGLVSCDSEEEGKNAVSDLTKLLGSGGFHLTKFLANDPVILESVPNEDKSPAVTELELGESATGKTLGLIWNVNSDTFVFNVHINQKPATRRGMLSEASQLFDPAGMVSPAVLPARLILQELCAKGCDWDAPVTGPLRDKWDRWMDKLPSLKGLSIARYVKPLDFSPVQTELHCFCDASTVAYGCCAYLRFISEQGEIHCSLIKGISRVNPRQVITIPRLELIGAVTAVEMAHEIQKELDIPLDGVYYHTDSTTVLQMIKSTSNRFKIFVANRLNLIHMLSKPEQWCHVASENNPSDLASRGISPDKLCKTDSWFTGPPILYDKNYDWNEQPLAEESDLIVNHEMKVNFTNIESTDRNSKLPQFFRELLNKHSKFETLRTSVAWLKRFTSFIVDKYGQTDRQIQVQTGPLQAAELDAATNVVCKLIQIDSLSEERSYFSSQKEPGPPIGIKGKLSSAYAKAILKCNPFMCDNILRVGGRLSHADVPYSQKYPIILPPYHHSTKLIIDYHHRRLGHSGTLHVLSSIRERHWILHGQSAVAKALRECMPCRLRDAKPGEQWMADLPSARVSIGQPIFSNTYCDYFGPITVKLGRNSYKRYGVIFTCLSTRAVHLEVAENLDTSAFLQAFTRFTSRRLPPQVMRSDNGTNLVSGSKELEEGIKRWNKKYLESSLAQRGYKWEYAPPRGSHHGGAVERLVKECKKILKNLVGDKGLTDYSLWTFMCGVESILNDRPLTK